MRPTVFLSQKPYDKISIFILLVKNSFCKLKLESSLMHMALETLKSIWFLSSVFSTKLQIYPILPLRQSNLQIPCFPQLHSI